MVKTKKRKRKGGMMKKLLLGERRNLEFKHLELNQKIVDAMRLSAKSWSEKYSINVTYQRGIRVCKRKTAGNCSKMLPLIEGAEHIKNDHHVNVIKELIKRKHPTDDTNQGVVGSAKNEWNLSPEDNNMVELIENNNIEKIKIHMKEQKYSLNMQILID